MATTRARRPDSSLSRLRRAVGTHGVRGLPGLVRRQAWRRLRIRPGPTVETHVDLSAHTADPIAAYYLSEGRRPVIEVPLASLRWSHLGFRGDDAASNPFVRTVVDEQAGRVTGYEGSALQRHHRRWRPTTAAEVYGIEAVDAHSPFAGPAAQLGLPWSARTSGYDRGVPARPPVGAGHGERRSAEEGTADFERLRAAAASIAEHGFVPEMGGYIRVGILVHGSSWVARMYAGSHRLAAVAAMGIDPVKVAINDRPQFVRREEVDAWPGVRSGLYTVGQALEVFDRIFRGEPPSWYGAPG